jgi:PAS domain-containing protein
MLAGEVDELAVERRAICKDGRLLWLQVRSSVQREADGRIEMIITQLVDVTAQRAQEEKLRESEARLRTIFETAPIGMALIAPEGELLQANRALAAMLGRAGEARARLTVPEVIPTTWRRPVRRWKPA